MSKWNPWVLTKKGQALYAKVDAGNCKLNLVKMAIGDGTPTELEKCTDLANKVLEMDITKISVQNETMCTVEAALNTSLLTDTVSVSEWGLYASDPDEGEILLGMTTDPEPDKLEPGGGVVAYEQTMGMTLVTSSAKNVSISIPSSAFVTKSSLDEAEASIKEKNKTELEGVINSKFANQYNQVTKLNTAALRGVYIPVEDTADFIRPPLEFLKLRDDGVSETLTICDFTNGDASDFVENSEMVFDGTMHLNTHREVAMTAPVDFAGGTLSITEEMDLSQYQEVAEVKLS